MIILNTLVTVNIFILASILFFRKDSAFPNKILALIFLIPGLNFANNINILSGTIYTFPYFYFVVQGTAVAFAPLVYYYILILMGKKITWQKTLFSLSALLLIYTTYQCIDFIFKPLEMQSAYITSILQGPYPVEMEVYGLLFFLLQLVYFTFGARDIYQYRKNAKNILSDIQSTQYQYLKHFIILFWLLTLLSIILYATVDAIYVEYIYLPLVILILYIFILYYAFHYQAVFTVTSFEEQSKQGVNTEIQAFANINSDVKTLYPEDLPQQVKTFIRQEKAYKDPEITLQKLSSELGFPAYQISRAINQGLNTSFYDLIHENRVDEARILLSKIQENNLSIEGVAYEVGFNSRTAFYRAFKKYTGKNPSEYLEKHV